MEIKKASCVLLISREGKILATSRRGSLDDIGLPGGKVDPGEDSETCALRELFEETGVQLERVDVRYFYTRECVSKTDCYSSDVFVCHEVDLESPLNLPVPYQREEGIQVTWADWADLLVDSNSFYDYNKALYAFFLDTLDPK